MKILIIFLLFNSVYAANLLRCLGQEESFYAKKRYTGPTYKLNQILIDEISSLSDLVMTEDAYQRVCTSKTKFPSLRLLKELVLNERQLFVGEDRNGIDFITLKSLRNNSGQILLKYISFIQSIAKDPKCIERNIPEVKILYSRYKYLEDEIPSKELMGNKKEIHKIFDSLANIDGILKKCEISAAKNSK